MTVILKKLYDVYGIGRKFNCVPYSFIDHIVGRGISNRWSEVNLEITRYSVYTSNSISEMEKWGHREYQWRARVMENAIKNKGQL